MLLVVKHTDLVVTNHFHSLPSFNLENPSAFLVDFCQVKAGWIVSNKSIQTQLTMAQRITRVKNVQRETKSKMIFK